MTTAFTAISRYLMKSIFTRLSDEEYRQVKEYARKHGMSIYEAVRELILLSLTEHDFKMRLLRIIELYARLDSNFRYEVEKILAEINEL